VLDRATAGEAIGQALEQGEAITPQSTSSAMTITPSKNASTGSAQRRQPAQHADVVALGEQRVGGGDRLGQRACQRLLGRLAQLRGVHAVGNRFPALRRMLRMRLFAAASAGASSSPAKPGDCLQAALEIGSVAVVATGNRSDRIEKR
jgi:hypothetical protein